MTLWYKMQFDNLIDSRREEGEIRARIRVPADSPWFDGHFPGEPVLPGIAQLGMVHDLLCRAFDQQLPVARVSRVRFRQMIRPEQQLTLAVQRDGADGSHRFRITGDEGSICSGQLLLAPGTDGKIAPDGTFRTTEN
jgi:3-hydroxymyristoyl/3-hydroxydecanoyl-(acyl carrier protein) dehydratase